MHFEKDVYYFLIIVSLLCVVCFTDIGVGELTKFFGRCLLGLAWFTFCVYCASNIFSAYIRRRSKSRQAEAEEARLVRKAEQFPTIERKRDEEQDSYNTRLDGYKERVLKPRQKEKQKKEDKALELITGWKGKGTQLGDKDGNEVRRRKDGGSSRSAADSRTLPDEVLHPPPVPQPPERKPPRKIVIPEEPAEGALDSITLIIRTPISRVLVRRFLISDPVQLLMDYATTCGFSQKVYDIVTVYPRNILSASPRSSLREMGLTVNCAVMLEEKE